VETRPKGINRVTILALFSSRAIRLLLLSPIRMLARPTRGLEARLKTRLHQSHNFFASSGTSECLDHLELQL
jgi:hypothetical protein